MPRKYEATHSFLTFELPLDLNKKWQLWQWMGEAKSKCQHIEGAPLPPAIAESLTNFYMAKGVQATTAIEGSPLTEQEVSDILNDVSKQPASREYLEIEVRNVAQLLVSIENAVRSGQSMPLSLEKIKEFNLKLLTGTEHEPNAIPGELRTHSVVVGNYLAAPAEDIEFLLSQLFTWINKLTNNPDIPKDQQFASTLIAAIFTHVYLAWIHPFGDGNGRTARLIEAQILVNSGMVPTPAMHLLSNHYNLTRDKYRRMFDEARTQKDLNQFLEYAIEGFVDGLTEQVQRIRKATFKTAWLSYIHEVMNKKSEGKIRKRQVDLVLALTHIEKSVKRNEISTLTPQMVQHYGVKGEKTITRDLNQLEALRLIRRIDNNEITANSSIMENFLPPIASGATKSQR